MCPLEVTITCMSYLRNFKVKCLLPWLPGSGENSAEIIARLKRDLLPTMINGVMYWPVCDFVTFKFTPVHLQVQLGLLQWSKLLSIRSGLWTADFCSRCFLTAPGEQLFFISMDCLHDIYGKSR